MFKLVCQIEITSGTVERLNCRTEQDVHPVRVDNSRVFRLNPPSSRHGTRDSHREHPQGIQHVDTGDRSVRT